MSIIEKYGWNDFFKAQFNDIINKDVLKPARVISQSSGIYKIICENGTFIARPKGSFLFNNKKTIVTGDWVVGKKENDIFIIHDIIQRKNAFTRKSNGDSLELHLLGANIDTIFIVTSADLDFSPERLSRYLFIIEECNANAVILINKSDKVENIDFYISEAQKVAPFVDIVPLSAISGYNIDKLEKYLSYGRTVLFTGSSGVGKSTLINLLSGSSQKVSKIREDDCEGRHTTTSRDLILRENGGVIIDIPGIREVQLGGSTKTIESIFPEITAFGYTCRFKDCTHTVEHGCRVLEALKDGEISQKLYDNYIKMRKEIIFYERENSQREKEKYEKKYKDIAKSIRKMKKAGKI